MALQQGIRESFFYVDDAQLSDEKTLEKMIIGEEKCKGF